MAYRTKIVSFSCFILYRILPSSFMLSSSKKHFSAAPPIDEFQSFETILSTTERSLKTELWTHFSTNVRKSLWIMSVIYNKIWAFTFSGLFQIYYQNFNPFKKLSSHNTISVVYENKIILVTHIIVVFSFFIHP